MTKNLSMLRMSRELSKEHPEKLFLVSFLFFLESILELFGMALIVPVFNKFLGSGTESNNNFKWLDNILESLGVANNIEYVLLIMVILYIVRAGIMYISRNIISTTSGNLLNNHQTNLIHSFLNFEIKYFALKRQGDLVNSIMQESSRAALSFLYFAQWLSLIFSIALNIFIACFVSIKLAFIAALLGAVMFYPLRFITRECERIGQITTKLNEDLQSTLVESLSMIKFIKASSFENSLEKKIKVNIDKFTHNYGNTYFYSGAMPIFSNPIGVIILSVILFVGVKEGLNTGSLLLFLAAFQRLLPNYSTLHGVKNNLLVSYPGFELIKKIKEENKDYYERKDGKEVKRLNQINIKNLNFSYSDGTKVFDNLSLSIGRGETIALVGPSGHGKTTLVDLILGFYKVNENQLFINDEDLTQLSLSSWRKKISYVTQDSVLFNDSVKNNITWGMSEYCNKRLDEVIRLAGADFVFDLKDGLDTITGDRGATLSGGQRQRISLARALMREPELLILDEATSALDHESELIIKNSIEKLKNQTEITIIMIAHRMETVKSADKILVIKNGNIVESGKWSELVSDKNSFFSQNMAHLLETN
jgi:ABC-type multidrug transport system fused ATPase/permease subunit